MVQTEWPDATEYRMSITYSTTCDSTIGPTDSIPLVEWPDDSTTETYTIADTVVSCEEPEVEPVQQAKPKWRKEKKTKPKIRQGVKIHNPPGGWGLGRF